VFLIWFSRDEAANHEVYFVEKVTVRRRWHPVDTFVVVGWALILTKCVLASIAIHHWDAPIHDFYVWGPSLIFGGVCTFLYLRREEE
jgi:hypothetical protein